MNDQREHDDVVRESFTRQVELFTSPSSPFARRVEGALAWLEPLEPQMVVLEIACGAAHVAEQVAPHVRQVVGIDLTRSLLDAGATRIGDVGIDNVLLQEGNAEALPFVDGSFDVVCCRASLHHFGNPHAAVAQMVRVCRPGGRVVISDLVAPSADVRDEFDRLHRLIDPSHARAFLEGELAPLFPDRVEVSYGETTTTRLPIDIALTDQSDYEPVLDALRAEIAGGPATGFAPTEEQNTIVVAFTSALVRATIPVLASSGRT
jgi:ubiquinone/menaquinone biosynthesis C-methylase UbiE